MLWVFSSTFSFYGIFGIHAMICWVCGNSDTVFTQSKSISNENSNHISKKKNVVSIKTEKTFSSQQNTELNKILKVRKCSILGNNKARLEKDFHVLL